MRRRFFTSNCEPHNMSYDTTRSSMCNGQLVKGVHNTIAGGDIIFMQITVYVQCGPVMKHRGQHVIRTKNGSKRNTTEGLNSPPIMYRLTFARTRSSSKWIIVSGRLKIYVGYDE